MYKLNYDSLTGKVSCIIKSDKSSIPLCEGNIDYQDFLKWNAEQEIPLNLESTIPVITPEPARDLGKEVDDLRTQIKELTPQVKVDHEDRIKALEK